MATGEPTSGPPAPPRVEDQEPIYEGAPGRTRLRSIHVPLSNGFVRTLQVYEVVNVGTEPHLQAPTLAGALHRFDTGETLAIPFVYHDPHARKFALVVPEVLRHEELALRAKLLRELAEHGDSAVPRYVAEARTVIGPRGLSSYLEASDGASTAELAQREATLAQQQTALSQQQAGVQQRQAEVEARAGELQIQSEALAQREARLQSRAEQVTRREDELRERAEEVEAARTDLAMREQELESRLEALVEREAELAQRRARRDEEPGPAADDVVELVGDSDVKEVSELEPLETSPGDIAEAVQLVDDDAPAGAEAQGSEPTVLDPEQDVEELVEDVEELEEVEELPEEVTGLHASPRAERGAAKELRDSKTTIISADELMPADEELPAPSVPPPPPGPTGPTSAPPPPLGASFAGVEGVAPSGEPSPPEGPQPEVPPPRELFASRHGPSALVRLHEGEPRVFARVPEGREADLFEDEPPELLAQLVVVEECPVVLLTVVERTEGRPVALRAPLDPRSAQRAILEALERRFAATVELFAQDGRYLRGLGVQGPREGNVARIRERVAKMRTAAAVDVATGIDRVLSAPPPVRAKRHPFDEEPPGEQASAREVKDALDAIARWSTHDELDHARLVLSIPDAKVDRALRGVLERAVERGLALPERLVDRAVTLGVAEDAAALIWRQLEAFRALSSADDHGGLDDQALADGWEQLLKAAADHEVSVDTRTHEVAWTVLRRVRGEDAGPSDVDPDTLGELGVPQLRMLLEHPRFRRDAAVELARRDEPELAEALCAAARKMPRAEVVRVVPEITLIGDAAGDAMIDGLAARKTFVRQAFALGLGHLRLRRSVVPLLHLLASERSEVWREIARVLGSFGKAGVRTVARQLKDPKGLEERYVLTLAHLANHGCEKQVGGLESSEQPAIAAMAREAMATRAQARSYEDRVRGAPPFGTDDGVGEFSQRFYEELQRARSARGDDG